MVRSSKLEDKYGIGSSTMEKENKNSKKYLFKMAADREVITDEKSTFFKVVKPFIAIFVAELIGTMILMFIGCASCIDYDGDPVIPHHLKSLGFGFAVLVAIQIFGHISACHINPAVSIVSLLLKNITIIQFIVYIVAEFLGAFLGFGLLRLLYPNHYTKDGFCITKVDGGITLTQGFFVELVITCILCFVVCSVWDERNATHSDSTPLRFSIVVGVISMIAGPLTGASMNTARSFGAAAFGSQKDWEDQWVFWIAPNLAPFISVGIYKLFLSRSSDTTISRRDPEDETGFNT